jgi:hypothetical protein
LFSVFAAPPDPGWVQNQISFPPNTGNGSVFYRLVYP